MVIPGQKLREICQKQTETDRNGQKQTEIKENGQKMTETDRNRQKKDRHG